MDLSFILPALAPQLKQLVNGLRSIDTQYGVKDASWLIRREPDEKGQEQVVLCFVHTEQVQKADGTFASRMSAIRNPDGSPVKYGIEQLIPLITGSKNEE